MANRKSRIFVSVWHRGRLPNNHKVGRSLREKTSLPSGSGDELWINFNFDVQRLALAFTNRRFWFGPQHNSSVLRWIYLHSRDEPQKLASLRFYCTFHYRDFCLPDCVWLFCLLFV